ncbi:MFS general substrate transporter [Pluteus cervinus]|uniref:MFS general substrate transporter n=1 Tax=Pluteus cervinus TaxID=181527 RepID=A0ACD3B3A6_9AGAR|nr:MFS general substrate transporter [Pluteus cervinus]
MADVETVKLDTLPSSNVSVRVAPSSGPPSTVGLSERRHVTAPSPDTFSSGSITAIASPDEFSEGGYGWVVVAACSVLMFFSIGGCYSWGVIQAQLANENLGPNSTLAFIGSISVSCIAFGALINGRLIRLLGSRKAALLASLFLGGGQILSGFSTHSIGGLFVTNGVLVGFGTSMCFLLGGTTPAQYFMKRRGLANGLVYGGAGVGGAVLSIADNVLIERVGVAWTFRIMGLLTLVITLPASMMLKDRARRVSATVEWSLFRDPKFILLFIGSGIATFPLLVPPFFLPLYAQSLGISSTIAAILLAVFNISSALGRVGFGFLSDVTGPITSLSLSLLLSGLSIFAIWPVSNTIAPLVVFIILNGLGNGGFFSTVPSVVGFVYGPNRVTTILAMVLTGWAAGYMLGSPVAGWLFERYGGSDGGRIAYRPAMYYAGSLSFGSAAFIMVMRYLVNPKLFRYA